MMQTAAVLSSFINLYSMHTNADSEERVRSAVSNGKKGLTGCCHREKRSTNIFGETGWEAGSTFDTGHGWPCNYTQHSQHHL